MTWEDAVRNIATKGYFITENGTYIAKVSKNGKYHYLGTYGNVEDAEEVVFQYRADRLRSVLDSYELDIEDAIIFKEKYLVFSNGLIFNLNGRKMAGKINSNGETLPIYRVVAKCFVPNPYGYPEVKHLNGIKTDNRVENLKWCTKKENMIHGEKHYASKLTEEQVHYIRKSKKTDHVLAKKLGVSQSTISFVRNGKTWKNV